MIPFDLEEPRSFAEAVELLDTDDPTVRALGGGTALMLMMKAGVFRPTQLVSLRRIAPAHSHIDAAGAEVRIGALATLSAVERSPVVRQALPVVARALLTLSNVRVRNVATLGGHLAHGDPHMDLPPVLMALGANVTALGPGGERTILLEDFYKGYYETALGSAELITEVRVPLQPRRSTPRTRSCAKPASS
jgi:carbon-monoxide dehydrogenase medium subunit